MEKKQPEFYWDEVGGLATCLLTDGENSFMGVAVCDEEDQDMKSEKTGCQIALWRAEIKYYTHLRDNEIKPALKALKHVYSTMKQNSHFDRKSYENRLMWRHIRSLEIDLVTVNKMLATTKENLKEYLQEKEKFYEKVRTMRKIGQN